MEETSRSSVSSPFVIPTDDDITNNEKIHLGTFAKPAQKKVWKSQHHQCHYLPLLLNPMMTSAPRIKRKILTQPLLLM
jgi:hypothetical protein